jgi:hypothetical protein
MTGDASMAAKVRHGIERELNGIKYTIDQWDGKNASDLVKNLRKMTLDALDVLRQPDPLIQKIGFVILAIQQSTDVRVEHRNSRILTRVTILDKELYDWAMAEVHKLPGKLT